MAKYTITDFGRQHLEAMKKLKKSSDNALKQAGLYLEGQLKYEVEKDSYDRGTLAESITTTLVRSGLVEVGTNLGYALVREEGRDPGTYPNFDALAMWAGRKGMLQGGATKNYDNLHYKDRGIVFVIARSIAERGIEGKYTFENVRKREENNVRNLYRNLLKNAQS